MTSLNNIKKITAGEVIIQQGDEGNAAYIIESGSVEILIEKDNGLVQRIGTRGAGTIIGEMALIDSKPRTATIKTVEDCELIEISRNDFNRRIESSDPVIQMMMQVILARYRDMLTRAHVLGRPKDAPVPEELEKGLVEKANAIENIKVIHELERGIKDDEMVLHYQPIVNLNDSSIAGYEALVRWKHPKKGMIPPDNFIPAAEDSGLIIELTKQAVEKACLALSNIQKLSNNNSDHFISINFSSKDFARSDFKSYITNVLEKHNLEPHQIHIEITERLLMDHPTQARETLEDCRQSGMIISIDDFGTGYSSLSYLHYFPIDILKIDRSFVDIMNKDESSMELVKSIISLGHNMKMSIIAEGIENEEQATTLKDLGVDKAQGYFFGRQYQNQKFFNTSYPCLLINLDKNFPYI